MLYMHFRCDEENTMTSVRLRILMLVILVEVGGATHAFLHLLQEADYDVNSDPVAFHRRGTSRPAPSDKLPVLDLIENPSTVFDPPETELNHRKLRKALGRDFDSEFMGIGRPILAVFQPNGTVTVKKRKGRPKERRPDYIQDIGKPIRYGNQMRLSGLNVNRRTKRKIKKYMWNYTHCPVVYAWKDLGIRFWPQWIKEGHCYNGRSCSIPPGMSCRPTGSITRTIFRWHCPLNKKGQLMKCKWIRIQYPIITECSCSC